MASAPSRKELTHDRIVQVAARAIRRSGYQGTGVADLMKEAGLTHGGFYAHFASRDALLAEAADRAGAEGIEGLSRIAATAPAGESLSALITAYLSRAHVDHPELGCPVAALGSEMPRQAPEVRRAATLRIKELIDLIGRQLPNWGEPGAYEEALVLFATLAGTLMLARAVDEPRLADTLRHATLKRLGVKKG